MPPPPPPFTSYLLEYSQHTKQKVRRLVSIFSLISTAHDAFTTDCSADSIVAAAEVAPCHPSAAIVKGRKRKEDEGRERKGGGGGGEIRKIEKKRGV